MSFFCNFKSDRSPGPINGNPANGLCEKVCIEAKKVFDACMRQFQSTGVVLDLSNNLPSNPTYPLTFVSAKSTTSVGTVTALTVTPLQDKECQSRVQVTVSVPVSVAYVDANGVEGTATSSMNVVSDVILTIPKPSMIPYNIEAVVSMVASEGIYSGENQFTVDPCVTLILKVVTQVELLIPSYGYSAIPPCQEYTQEVCAGFFELPVYPL